MAVLGKRKAVDGDNTLASTRSCKATNTAHIPAMQRSTRTQRTSLHDANKENIIVTQKRKRGCEEQVEIEVKPSKLAAASARTTPQGKRACKSMPLSPIETPSRKTARLFDRLDLQTSRMGQNGYDTPPVTPDRELSASQDLFPAQLTDLVTLHAAFGSAINNATALDSSAFRLPMRDILSATTTSWRRRTATLEDIRKVMAVSGLEWSLEDYGRAGMSLVRQGANGQSISILDGHRMKRTFELELRRQYTQWQQVHHKNTNVEVYIAQLPLAPISCSDTVTLATQSRGKARLHSIRDAQSAASTTSTITIDTTEHASTKSRSSNLLDRVLAKQAFNASLPAGPSKLQLERKGSLQRVEEVARVLDMLSSGRARASFSMLSVVQQIQQSLRSPVSRVEVERCLSIMATEIMPQFVSIVASGSVIGVVITRAGKLGLADLKKTLADADI